jgi:hypothetical protein
MFDVLSRLPFSLDPLMAEAKRRARQRRGLVALGVLLVAGLAAGLTFAFRSPSGGSERGASAIRTGMTAKTVRVTAGRPVRVVRSNPRNPDCWVYAVNRNGLSDEQVAVCFKHGRVSYIGTRVLS